MGRVTVEPIHFTQVQNPPLRYVNRGFTLTSDSLASGHVTIYAATSVLDNGDPSDLDIPEGTFQIRFSPLPRANVLVTTGGLNLSMGEGTLTLRRVGETIEGTIRGEGRAKTFGGRTVREGVRATFVAVLDAPVP